MDEPRIDLPLVHRGKVRELYALDGERLLMVASDRISAFDHVLATLVPDKGVVLTALSRWWFDRFAGLVPNHLLPGEVPEAVRGRAVVCERLRMVPVECVARGYLAGSGWAEYADTGSVCGVRLPPGLVDGSRLPEPVFTPAAKAPAGEHDQNVDFATVADTVGADLAGTLRDLTLALYTAAAATAAERGLVLADTKVEFGLREDGTVVLADELLTPDSSRFWEASTWQPGRSPASFDKQFVRDWLTGRSGWDRHSDRPPPPLPAPVVAATRERYVTAYERLTGRDFADALASP